MTKTFFRIGVVFAALFLISKSALAECADIQCALRLPHLNVELPTINAPTIDPYDDTVIWKRTTPLAEVHKGTLQVITKEIKSNLAPYFSEGVSFYPADCCANSLRIRLGFIQDPKTRSTIVQADLAKADALKNHGYGLFWAGGSLHIVAHDALGLLYGTYGLLDKLGFRWFAPDTLWEVKPATLQLSQGLAAEYITPKTRLRGYWVYDAGPTANDDFLIWMARNRYNLIGQGHYNLDLAKALGIKIWAGGHSVISSILDPKKKMENGRLLGQHHPEWYGFSANPTAEQVEKHYWNKETYTNPCVLDPGLISYFASQLSDALQEGAFRNVDLLNIWLSDTKPMRFPKNCKPNPLYDNPTDAVFEFYRLLIGQLNQTIAGDIFPDPVYLAGISYYTTWDLPQKVKLPVTGNQETVRYIHALYLNQRSFSEKFSGSKANQLNQRIDARFKAWADLLNRSGTEFGTVEYYNYSIYGSLPKIFAKAAEDNEAFRKAGSVMSAYMHVVGGNMGPQRLLHRMLSQYQWGGDHHARDGETKAAVYQDYFASLYPGQAQHAARAYTMLDRALDNITEMLGATSALVYAIHQNSYWAKPPIPQKHIPAIIQALLQGGSVELPVVYKTWPTQTPARQNIVGLSQSVAMLEQASAMMRGVALGAHEAGQTQMQQRAIIDLYWFNYARLVYSALEILAQKTLETQNPNPDASAHQAQMAFFEKHQRNIADQLEHFPFHNSMLSSFDQKKTLYKLIGISARTP